MKKLSVFLLVVVILTSCATIKPGEVAVKQRLGSVKNKVYSPGPVAFNFFTTRILRVPINLRNIEITSNLPSKEGLTIRSEISILYKINREMTFDIIQGIGMDYENSLILPVFRSAAADITSQFMAKDLHSGERSRIEREIKERMDQILKDKGFEIQAVLMKSIVLPEGLSQSIELKLSAEQDAQRILFEIEKERNEAEKKRIQAQGISDSQKILESGLTDRVLKYSAIEAFKQLANSPNAKVIITNGDTPFIVNPSE
jgi:prohibitin 1